MENLKVPKKLVYTAALTLGLFLIGTLCLVYLLTEPPEASEYQPPPPGTLINRKLTLTFKEIPEGRRLLEEPIEGGGELNTQILLVSQSPECVLKLLCLPDGHFGYENSRLLSEETENELPGIEKVPIIRGEIDCKTGEVLKIQANPNASEPEVGICRRAFKEFVLDGQVLKESTGVTNNISSKSSCIQNGEKSICPQTRVSRKNGSIDVDMEYEEQDDLDSPLRFTSKKTVSLDPKTKRTNKIVAEGTISFNLGILPDGRRLQSGVISTLDIKSNVAIEEVQGALNKENVEKLDQLLEKSINFVDVDVEQKKFVLDPPERNLQQDVEIVAETKIPVGLFNDCQIKLVSQCGQSSSTLLCSMFFEVCKQNMQLPVFIEPIGAETIYMVRQLAKIRSEWLNAMQIGKDEAEKVIGEFDNFVAENQQLIEFQETVEEIRSSLLHFSRSLPIEVEMQVQEIEDIYTSTTGKSIPANVSWPELQVLTKMQLSPAQFISVKAQNLQMDISNKIVENTQRAFEWKAIFTNKLQSLFNSILGPLQKMKQPISDEDSGPVPENSSASDFALHKSIIDDYINISQNGLDIAINEQYYINTVNQEKLTLEEQREAWNSGMTSAISKVENFMQDFGQPSYQTVQQLTQLITVFDGIIEELDKSKEYLNVEDPINSFHSAIMSISEYTDIIEQQEAKVNEYVTAAVLKDTVRKEKGTVIAQQIPITSYDTGFIDVQVIANLTAKVQIDEEVLYKLKGDSKLIQNNLIPVMSFDLKGSNSMSLGDGWYQYSVTNNIQASELVSLNAYLTPIAFTATVAMMCSYFSHFFMMYQKITTDKKKICPEVCDIKLSCTEYEVKVYEPVQNPFNVFEVNGDCGKVLIKDSPLNLQQNLFTQLLLVQLCLRLVIFIIILV